MKKKPFDWLRLGAHFMGLLPLLQLTWHSFTAGLGVNPIQLLVQELGKSAVNLLILSLAVTPVVTVTGWRALIKHRRTLGLYSFFYFSLHFFMFAVVDYGLNLPEILRLTTEKPFILVGVTAAIILLLLAITSFKFWMKKMGKGWQSLHRGVYIAAVMVIIHYAWAVKGNLSNLSGDILRPLVLGGIVTLLLLMRVPPVRKWLAGLRYKFRPDFNTTLKKSPN